MSTAQLSPAEIEKNLAEFPEWKLENEKIFRKFKFKNFREALDFVNRVGEISEAENHHPDMHLAGWNKVKVELSTHEVHGLSGRDFALARKIDSLTLS